MILNKGMISSIVGILGSMAAYLFGGWSLMMQTLLLVMIADYFTGIINAAVFKKSTKTKSGALSSKAGLKGLCKKVAIFILIIISYRIDLVLNLDSVLFDAVVIGFIANETISILENVSAMGVPIPRQLAEVLDSMKGD